MYSPGKTTWAVKCERDNHANVPNRDTGDRLRRVFTHFNQRWLGKTNRDRERDGGLWEKIEWEQHNGSNYSHDAGSGRFTQDDSGWSRPRVDTVWQGVKGRQSPLVTISGTTEESKYTLAAEVNLGPTPHVAAWKSLWCHRTFWRMWMVERSRSCNQNQGLNSERPVMVAHILTSCGLLQCHCSRRYVGPPLRASP